MNNILKNLPVFAIVGRPNVGKSTLFNALTKSRQAIVANEPGVTRDRLYGEGKVGPSPYILIDTGGVGYHDTLVAKTLLQDSEEHAMLAAKEADVVLWMVDASTGITVDDESMAKKLRALGKENIYLVVNKTDGLRPETACADFYQLGFPPLPIAASHGRGITQLMNRVFDDLPAPIADEEPLTETDERDSIHLAFIGKPNVGKSTLVNHILKEERVLVADLPGTTRDSIYIPFTKGKQPYTLIDTAGVRRRSRITETVEKFSVVKTLQTIEQANVCLFMLDAAEGVTDQDLHLIDFIIQSGKALVIAVNKWESLTPEAQKKCKAELKRRLVFAEFANMHFISALKGVGINALFQSIHQAYKSATQTLSTNQLTTLLEEATQGYAPPEYHGRRIKLRFAHAGGQNPPLIIIHGNQVSHLPESYQRYLINVFRKAINFTGTPLKLVFRNNENPYADKKNLLTPRQQRKKQRLMKFYKKSK